MATAQELKQIVDFVHSSGHGWSHQPTAKVVNAELPTNPSAECVEITVMEGHALSDITGRYQPVSKKVFCMAGARMFLGIGS